MAYLKFGLCCGGEQPTRSGVLCRIGVNLSVSLVNDDLSRTAGAFRYGPVPVKA